MSAPGTAPVNRPARLGLVSYLNSKPIGYGLLHGRQKGRFEVREAIPSELADQLLGRELDLALIPSIEYARGRIAGRELAIVPRIGISTFGPAESVLLFTRVPATMIRSVALDVSSRTSAGLLRLLLKRRLRPGLPDPEFLSLPPDLPSMLERCDAALLIGDRALFADREHPERLRGIDRLDLGGEWTAMTGLPFVYAFWAGPKRPDSAEITAALQESLEEGLGKIGEIAHEHGAGDAAGSESVRRYLTETIRYRLGREELAGLARFYELLHEEGLLGRPHPYLVFHRTASCVRDPR